MTALLDTLGTKLTERAVARLTVAGLLYVAMCLWAGHAGHTDAFAASRVESGLSTWWLASSASLLETLTALFLALGSAALAGLAAGFLGREVIGRVWVSNRAPDSWIDWRGSRWARAQAERGASPPELYRPARLTPIGDRFRLIAVRVEAQYGLSVPHAWPRLMIIADAEARSVVSDAYDRYRADCTLTAWGVLVLPWTIWWWPALPAAILLLAAGYLRSGLSAATLATLIESVIDIYQLQLATALGVGLPGGRLTPREGPEINNILNKRA